MTDTPPVNIFTALAAAQAEFSAPKKGALNPAFRSKYADLASVVEAVAPALSAHGVAFYHSVVPLGDDLAMRTTLAHGASGTEVHCDIPLIVSKRDMQGFKSACTYGKRIGLESVTGVAPEDDDGNAAAKSPPRNGDRPRSPEPRDHDKTPSADFTDPENPGLNVMPKGAKLNADMTPRQKAEAAASAIIAQYAEVRTVKGVTGVDERNSRIFDRLDTDYRDLAENVIDARVAAMKRLGEEEPAELPRRSHEAA